MSLFTHMSVDSMVRFGLGIAIVALFVAATCCCAIILKRQIVARLKSSEYSFCGAKQFHVPYWVLGFCTLTAPALVVYFHCLFVYEETLKQAGLL
ncbi:MAG: hypothetical protein HOJ16_08940 [Candidatus Peribacter sp.]|jgi:hypothetical protein|nr:hypothetical protein [Candidatus Peribacter sp.]